MCEKCKCECDECFVAPEPTIKESVCEWLMSKLKMKKI